MVLQEPFLYLFVSKDSLFSPEYYELIDIHDEFHSQDEPHDGEVDVKEVELFPISVSNVLVGDGRRIIILIPMICER